MHIKWHIGLLACCVCGPALAYVGPGPGLSMLGSALGLLVAIGFALLVVLAYPLRLLYRTLKDRHRKKDDA